MTPRSKPCQTENSVNRRPLIFHRRQRGAIAILYGLSILFVIVVFGLAIDLGQAYCRKTELQNAVDAAALAGARSLQLHAKNIAAAVTAVSGTFNRYKAVNGPGLAFSFSAEAIRFGSTPAAANLDVAAAKAAPAGLVYVQIDSALLGAAEPVAQVYTAFMGIFVADPASPLRRTIVSAKAVAGPVGSSVGLHQ